MGTGVVALEGEKVLPNVDFFSLAPAVDGTKVGPSVEVFHLSLAFQMERISSFSSFRSASVVLKSSNKSRCRASLNTPCMTSQSRSTVKALALTKLCTVGLALLRTQVQPHPVRYYGLLPLPDKCPIQNLSSFPGVGGPCWRPVPQGGPKGSHASPLVWGAVLPAWQSCPCHLLSHQPLMNLGLGHGLPSVKSLGSNSTPLGPALVC